MRFPFFLLGALVALGAPSLGAQQAPGARLDTTVALARDGMVSITSLGGDVVVTTWDRAEARVVADAGDRRVRIEGDGARLRVEPEHHAGGKRQRHARAEERYELTVPRGVRLHVEALSGDVSVTGVRQEVRVEVASGAVTLRDVGGRVEVELASGPLTITDADGTLDLEVASGAVTLTNVAGRVQLEGLSGNVRLVNVRLREAVVETMSGNVTYEGTVSGDGRYELRTHSGNVNLRLPDDTRARLTIESYNGEFITDFPVTMQPGGTRIERQTRFSFTLGDGSGPAVTVETFSGNVHLARPGARARTPRSDP